MSATRIMPWLVLLIGVAASAAIALNWRQLDGAGEEIRLQEALQHAELGTLGELRRHEDLLRSAQAALPARPSSTDLRRYARDIGLRERYPGAKALAYVPRGRATRRPTLSVPDDGGTSTLSLPSPGGGRLVLSLGGPGFLERALGADPARLGLALHAGDRLLATNGAAPADADRDGERGERRIQAYGQEFRLRAEARASVSNDWEPLVLAALGALLGVALAVLVRVLLRSEERAHRAADETSAKVLELQERLQSLAATPAGIFRTDEEGKVVFGNRRFEAVTHRPLSEARGHSWIELVHVDDRAAMARAWEVAAQEHEELARQFRLNLAGEEVWLSCRITHQGSPEGGWVGSLEDVTAQRRLEADLARRALQDPLTGLANRVHFNERLRQALARSRRSGTAIAVLFLDLDRFKEVNDSFGHETGDRVLSAVATRLAAAVRAEDTVARFGGDEFTVLCEDVESAEQAAATAERLVAALEDPFDAAGTDVRIAASVGVAIGRGGEAVPEDVLRVADAAMYRAKAGGEPVKLAE